MPAANFASEAKPKAKAGAKAEERPLEDFSRRRAFAPGPRRFVEVEQSYWVERRDLPLWEILKARLRRRVEVMSKPFNGIPFW